MDSYKKPQRTSGKKPSLIGMIRARKLAIKIKRRAQFLVADKRRRENCGKAILIHHDVPKPSNKLLGLNDERLVLSSDGRNLVSSTQYLTHSARDLDDRKSPIREYKTTPDHFIPVLAIESRITHILESRLNGMKYNPLHCKEMSKSLAEEIKKQVKTNYDLTRYKLVCVVNMGEIKLFSPNASVRFGSRCLWNTMFDNFASSFYQNNDLFAVATLYAVYFD